MIEIARCQLAEETQSIISSHRLSHLYDRENSATFFYSEIERCWIVIVNNGTVSINGSILSSSGNNSYVIEHKAQIVFGARRFVFYNTNSSKGISRVLVDSLLRSRKEKIKTGRVLEIIQEYCGSDKDPYFVLDCIRRNEIFNYKRGELTLNIEALCGFLKTEESPLKGSLEYELEHGFRSRGMGRSFNVSKIWDNLEFGTTTNKEPKVSTDGWPSLEALEAILERKRGSSKDVLESTPTSYKVDPLPSPRSSSRYINSYVIKTSRDIYSQNSKHNIRDLEHRLEARSTGKRRKSPEPPSNSSESVHSSNEMRSTSEDSDQSASSNRGETIVVKRRQEPAVSSKRCKYRFELSNKPVVEKLAMSGESDSSVVEFCSDTEIEKARSKPKPHPRSASCVEDGFTCEKSAGMLDELFSHRRRSKRLYKIKALAYYDVYKINKL